MIKLLKYEFIKQKNILLIPILASLSCLLFYFTTLGSSINLVAIKLFYMTVYFGVICVFYYPLYIFNTEIKNKSIIMPIMTPSAASTIITSRIIHSLIQIIIFSIVNIIIFILFLFNNPNLINVDFTNFTHDRLLFSTYVCLIIAILLITLSYLLITLACTFYNVVLKIIYIILIVIGFPALFISSLIFSDTSPLIPTIWYQITFLTITSLVIYIINTSLTAFLFNKKLNI